MTKKEEYLEWLKLSEEEKEAQGLPLTQGEMSQKIGVSEHTLSVWKRPPKDEKQEVLEYMKRLSKTNAQAAKVWYEMMKGETIQEGEISPDECIRLAKEVANRLELYEQRRVHNRDGYVPEEPAVLSGEVRMDSEQEYGAEG